MENKTKEPIMLGIGFGSMTLLYYIIATFSQTVFGISFLYSNGLLNWILLMLAYFGSMTWYSFYILKKYRDLKETTE